MSDKIGFSNEGRSTLNGNHTALTTTITIQTADAATFPASGAFDFRIIDEYIHVPASANAGGPAYVGVLRHQYGSAAAAYSNLTPVAEVVTASELAALESSVLIETATPSAVSTFDFAAIPAVYRHLKIRGVLKLTSATGFITLTFNGDTGANYSWSAIANPARSAATGASRIQLTDAQGQVSNYDSLEIDIPLYADAVNGGSLSCAYYAVDIATHTAHIGLSGGRWFGAAAITSITIAVTNGTFTGVLDLYGVA